MFRKNLLSKIEEHHKRRESILTIKITTFMIKYNNAADSRESAMAEILVVMREREREGALLFIEEMPTAHPTRKKILMGLRARFFCGNDISEESFH